MLEHIFRNLTDIRVFDAFYCEYCDGQEVDSHDILEILEYPQCEFIQIEDSINHLVKQHIIEEINVKAETEWGCKTCSYLDRLHLPRIGEHKKHKPFEKSQIEIINYRIALNDFTKYLFKALFEHMQFECDNIEKENKSKQMECIKYDRSNK